VDFLFCFKNKTAKMVEIEEKPVLKQNLRFKICSIGRAFCFILKIKNAKKVRNKRGNQFLSKITV